MQIEGWILIWYCFGLVGCFFGGFVTWWCGEPIKGRDVIISLFVALTGLWVFVFGLVYFLYHMFRGFGDITLFEGRKRNED